WRLGRHEWRPVPQDQHQARRGREIFARQQQRTAWAVHAAVPGPRPAPSGSRPARRIRPSRRRCRPADRRQRRNHRRRASLGANYDVTGDWKVGLSVSHNERSPAIDELFSNGPHGGSATFNLGDSDLKKEASNGIELSVHHTTGPIHLQGSIYYSRFSNFIFQAPT